MLEDEVGEVGRRALADSFLDRAPLERGSHIRLISPASPCPAEDVDWAVRWYTEIGFEVSLGDAVGRSHPSASYLAGSDEERRDDFVEAWLDASVDAIVCLRGGYGSMRILDRLDWAPIASAAIRSDGRPKLFTGSSDITALHDAVQANLGIPTLFCPMAGTGDFQRFAFVHQDVRRWLLEPWRGRTIVGPACEVLYEGSAHGTFTGGNLSLLAAGAVRRWSGATGDILFLEDTGDVPYRLDRYLTTLRQSGVLERASGIVLGSWQKSGDLGAVRKLMIDELQLGVPVLWEQGFGHAPNALSVPMGVEGTLEATSSPPRLTVGAA